MERKVLFLQTSFCDVPLFYAALDISQFIHLLTYWPFEMALHLTCKILSQPNEELVQKSKAAGQSIWF